MPNSPVSPEEELSKYILQKGDIRGNGTLKYQSMLPGPDGRRSVFRIYGLSEDEIWKLALEKVVPQRPESLVGRADLLAEIVYRHQLTILPDEDLQSRHADIAGWPQDKDEKMSIAQALAEGARVKRWTSQASRS